MFFAVYGAGLGYCAYRLRKLESWPRAPIVLAQLIQLGRGLELPRRVHHVRRGRRWPRVALLTLVAVFHPASLRALEDEDSPHPD